MKIVIIAVLSVAFSLSASAQFNQQQMNYRLKIEKYKKMKTTGILLTVAGGIGLIVGISNLSSATYTTTYTSNGTTQQSSSDPKALSGALLTLGGLVFIGTGIPLTIVGSAASRKYQRKLEATTVHFNITPQQQGIGISYKF
jgi:uncharacterized BrkB/YihY/UPF0761 family membrane protein